MTTLSIISRNQGMTYDETTAVAFFSPLEIVQRLSAKLAILWDAVRSWHAGVPVTAAA
jgi:hypothetical protein